MIRRGLDISQEARGYIKEHVDVLVASIANQRDHSVAVTLPCLGRRQGPIKVRHKPE